MRQIITLTRALNGDGSVGRGPGSGEKARRGGGSGSVRSCGAAERSESAAAGCTSAKLPRGAPSRHGSGDPKGSTDQGARCRSMVRDCIAPLTLKGLALLRLEYDAVGFKTFEGVPRSTSDTSSTWQNKHTRNLVDMHISVHLLPPRSPSCGVSLLTPTP